MGFNSKIQHYSTTTCYSTVFRSSISPWLPISRSFSERRKSGSLCNPTAATCSQGAQIAEKPTSKKPKWLLPVEERAENSTNFGEQNRSLFQVILTTSKDHGSGISDLSAGVLLALIGENGSCFMHRLSNLASNEQNSHSLYRFQRGAQDVVTFSGPDLGKLAAVWVAPEQGTWRIQDMVVRVSSEPSNGNEAGSTENGSKILQYSFVCEEALIGDDEPTSAVELQVSSTSEISYEEFLHVNLGEMVSRSQTNFRQERDEGMREYETLKFSLLSYDALLVIGGSAIAAVAGQKEVSGGFLAGGILGLFYLFILERAVDQLPAPSLSPLSVSTDEDISATTERKSATEKVPQDMKISEKKGLQQVQRFSGFRASLTRFLGFLAVCVLIARTINSEDHQALSKEMLLAGAAGFLMTKFATVLAANIPLKGRHEPFQNQ